MQATRTEEDGSWPTKRRPVHGDSGLAFVVLAKPEYAVRAAQCPVAPSPAPFLAGTKRSWNGTNDERSAKRLRTEHGGGQPQQASETCRDRTPCDRPRPPADVDAPAPCAAHVSGHELYVASEHDAAASPSSDRGRDVNVEEQEESASSLPAPPTPPFVGVMARGPATARVVWDVGPPAVRADGTPVETAAVRHYELYVCRERVAEGPDPVPWLMIGQVARPGEPGELMYREISGLPTGQRLHFAVMPVDVYGRQADDFGAADVTL